MAGPDAAASALRLRPTVWPWLASAGVLAVLLVVYPPFHVESRRAAVAPDPPGSPAAFAPAEFAARFWTAELQPAASHAAELAPVLAAVQRDPVAAANAHAHRVGLGHAAFFFLRGSGRVTAVERSRLLVEVAGAIVAIRTGPVFGNVVRDGCGLLDVNQVPGLTEFNALSAELNRLVETRVLPTLKAAAKVGATVVFAGCAEAPESLPGNGAPLLTFIPLQAEVKP
jgi:predicted lipoprotein